MTARAPIALGLAAAGLVLLGPRAALAQEEGFGIQRPFVVSLEHLGGVSWQKVETEEGGGISFSGDGDSTIQAGFFTPFFGFGGPRARLGLHYFVSPPVSAGLILNYNDSDAADYLLVGARVGVAFPLSTNAAVWLRGGVAYESTDYSGMIKMKAFVPGGEVLLAIEPVEHFGFLIGGLFERTVGGKIEVQNFLGPGTVETDYTRTEIALSAGVFASF